MKSPFWRTAFLMVAQTVGAGIFALPLVFSRSGWLVGLGYLLLTSSILAAAHKLYFRVLYKTGGRHRLAGLLSAYFGKKGKAAGLWVVNAGLTLTLVLYLILAGTFAKMMLPDLGGWSLVAVWIICSIPLLLRLKNFVRAELVGTVLMFLVVGYFFVLGLPNGWMKAAPLFNQEEIFYPFGIMVFALAGWPAIQPIMKLGSKTGLSTHESMRAASFGTYLSMLLYGAFVFGILGQIGFINGSGLESFSSLGRESLTLLVILGFFAIWTSYGPIAKEVEESLVEDLGWKKDSAISTVLFLPPILVLLGINNFTEVAGLVGGVFLGLEYVLILYLADKALFLKKKDIFLSNLLKAVFLLAAVYEIYYFIVK